MLFIREYPLLSDQLRLVQKQEVLAQCAADMGDPVRTTLYTGKATEHLDHHDIILELVNPMLLEQDENSVQHLTRGAPDVWMQHSMQEIESTQGPVSTTSSQAKHAVHGGWECPPVAFPPHAQ